MKITVTGKQIDVGDALRSHVSTSLASIVDKYFDRAIEAHVVFGREAHLIRADLSVHVGRGLLLQGEARAVEAYSAFETAAQHIDKRLRRYKRRLRDHHAKDRDGWGEERLARSYVLAADETPGDDAEDAMPPAPSAGEPQPVIIAEMETAIPLLTVSEAVMRMDLGGVPALMFRNRAHGQLNVIYRRADGNIGWIDPGLAPPQGGSSS
jgi:ribosomal subunit interface protein